MPYSLKNYTVVLMIDKRWESLFVAVSKVSDMNNAENRPLVINNWIFIKSTLLVPFMKSSGMASLTCGDDLTLSQLIVKILSTIACNSSLVVVAAEFPHTLAVLIK